MNKLKIFDSSKHLKILKIVALSFAGLLLLWFTFDITGLKFGKIKIVTSAFVDEPIDFVFLSYFHSKHCLLCTKRQNRQIYVIDFSTVMGYFSINCIFQIGRKYSRIQQCVCRYSPHYSGV